MIQLECECIEVSMLSVIDRRQAGMLPRLSSTFLPMLVLLCHLGQTLMHIMYAALWLWNFIWVLGSGR